MPKYTKEQLIFYLKKRAAELKRTPRIKDMKMPSYSSYVNRFGSWNRALREASLQLNLKKKYERKELIDNIRMLSKELARVPSPKDLKGREWAASYKTYVKHFGAWENAIKEAGISKETTFNLRKFVSR
jgi:Cdc6-like AAA superfamily ATPase